MTPAHTDSPLRRSEVGLFREGNQNVTINDDEEERREARRRTILRQSNASGDSSTFEENETLKKCLEIYNGNKLSRDNAWSLSLIDTLSALLDRHHKSLNNFKVAGSSLEASSKVYGLRVDSIHIDVMRMSAGLNAQKFNEKNLVDDDDVGVAVNADVDNSDPNSTTAGNAQALEQPQIPIKKPKRQRRVVSTITKNKETLNARLDTVPLQDPVFGKLNLIVGSINSSNRLMTNILLTTDSELRLRTNFPFWDSSTLEKCDFTEKVSYDENIDAAPCDRLFKVENFEELQLRPTHGGYVISDTPEVIADDKDNHRLSLDSEDGGGGAGDGSNTDIIGGGLGNGTTHNPVEMSMAFDINAECEPMPPLNEQAPMIEVDFEDFDELTTDERTAINNCRGLRKTALLIEDLRPVDASSKLEYSYRPLDKISQFWAGPSHWKFKRRTRPSTMYQNQQVLSSHGGASGKRNLINQRAKRAAAVAAKQRSKQLNFGEDHDDLYIKLDENYKARKANVQKKWDQRKLKLPTDLQVDPMLFFKYSYAPGVPVEVAAEALQDVASPDLHGDDHPMDNSMTAEYHFGDDDDGVGRMEMSLGGANLMNVSTTSASGIINEGEGGTEGFPVEEIGADGENVGNNTVLEIATDFEGAPSQVTKIIVPFAKRAKVIDMKNLKRCCTQLLTRQMKRPIDESQIPQHPIAKDESYAKGMASFKEIYDELPELLTQNMTQALSPSIAFYSMLHLANDYNLRLVPQEDLDDFKIRQVML